MTRFLLLLCLVAGFLRPALADPASVMIEELTWPEIKARMEAGATTISMSRKGMMI